LCPQDLAVKHSDRRGAAARRGVRWIGEVDDRCPVDPQPSITQTTTERA
jgi:hypothetical protein